MRLTSFTDYGLRMLMRMASAPETAFSTAELADEFGLSRHHLTKIMQRLAQGGIVATRRGGGAGATLARAPSAISLGSAVRLLEEGQPLVECFAATGGRLLHHRLLPPESPTAQRRGGVSGRSRSNHACRHSIARGFTAPNNSECRTVMWHHADLRQRNANAVVVTKTSLPRPIKD